MPLIEWSDRLSVGIGVIDKDHQTLVRMLNDVADAVAAAKSKEVLSTVLAGLVSYTQNHFAREEQLFALHGYPDAESHKKEHEALTQKVREVQQKFQQGSSNALGMEVMTFLKNWLLQHIQGSDRAYAPFMRSKGVQ